MFPGGDRSDATYADYNAEAMLTIRQYVRECGRPDIPDMDYTDICVAAVAWTLGQDYRWQWNYIRKKCAALQQFLENLVACELISAAEGNKLLDALEHQRPAWAQKDVPRHPAWQWQKKQRKTVRATNLRRLIRYFKERQDRISAWIVGYLIVASRVGWRPGEMLALQLNGRLLSAPAKKVGNFRGLFDTVEIMIGARYPEKYLVLLHRWIAETESLTDIYGSRAGLRRAMAEQVRRACKVLRIPGLAPYALRHFAIASFKRSGWSREKIAAVVNHATDRTAGEGYGKARNGIKRPQPIFSVDPARVAAVRRRAKEFTPRDNHAHRV